MSREQLTARITRRTVGLLAFIAYVPALLTKPGRIPTDTKLYLYLDPGRLIADAPFTWDTRQFGGWVPHQTIAYLWPQGPFYWFFDTLGVPDWVAHRLWIGTLLLVAALGVHWAARLLGLPKQAAVVAAVVYMLSPYILPYVSRTSAMLLPWAALGWLVGLTIRSVTSHHRWRHPALMALVLLSCSAVNATAVLMIAPAPVLWLLHATMQRTITWRRAVAASARIGGLGALVSLWWVMMLRAQGTYGADVLLFSESLEATSLTSASTETLRGMGYWLFYVRDPYAFTTTAAQRYMESGQAIAISFLLLLVCIAGLAFTRWSQRRYAAILVFVGIVLAVGVHPIFDASPLMSPLAENSRSSLALAIRSSTRALPMSTFGFALGAGALVAALATTRWKARVLAPLLVVLLAVANLPALFDGTLVDPALERDEQPPAAWLDAAAALSATSSEYRVLELPGSEFGAFRWGYTVDPPLPGLTTKPLVTRDLLPLGSPGVMDLLYALDDRVQDRSLDPAALAAVARALGVDTVWLANDLAFDRFRTPRPEEVSAQFQEVPGLGAPVAYGSPEVNQPDIPMVDETALSSQVVGTPLPPVELIDVLDPVPIVRASDRVVVVVGSGDGIIDAAAAGLLDGSEAILYAADLSSATSDGRDSFDGAVIIITDSNRDRAHHWRSSQDVTGFTEMGGDNSDVQRVDEGDQRLPVFGPNSAAHDQTIATLDTGLVVLASGYGEPFAYRPEQRPAMAVDGDVNTAWVVADRADPLGHFLRVSDTAGTLQLLQPPGNANRMITSVRIDTGGGHTDLTLDDSSLTAPGQLVTLPAAGPASITITGVGPRLGGTDTGPSAVGFAEVGLGTNTEVVRTPNPTVTTADGPVAVVLARLTVDPLNRWRSDPEATLQREFTVPAAGEYQVSVTLQRNDRATDLVLDRLDGVEGAVANRRLTGVPDARGRFATDGDTATAWTSPFIDAVDSQLTIPLDGTPLSELRLQQTLTAQHSVITGVTVQVGSSTFELAVPTPDSDGISTLTLPTTVSGDTLLFTVTAVEQRTTIDRRFGELTTLPVAIAELTADAVIPPRQIAPPQAGCRDDLLVIDGQNVPVQLTVADLQALATGASVTVPTCDPVSLTQSSHRLSTTSGLISGIDVDRVLLDHGALAALAAGSPPPSVEVSRTRTTRTATVAACPDGCWLIMGEGYNTGWTAEIGGTSLGEPQQISGGFNGWWVPPSSEPTRVDIQWHAQRPVTLGLVVSAVAVLACIVLAVGRRRRSADRANTPWTAEHPSLVHGLGQPLRLPLALATGVGLVVLTAVVASPTAAVLAGIPAALLVVTRRTLVAGAGALLLAAAIGARMVQRQIANRFSANAGWPGLFERLHEPGLIVVTLLVAATFLDRDATASDTPPTTEPHSERVL